MEFLSYALLSVTVYLGVLIGIALYYIAEEEIAPYRNYLKFAKAFLFAAVLSFLAYIYTNLMIAGIVFVILLAVSLKIEIPSVVAYPVFGIILYILSRFESILLLNASAMFLYGFPAASLMVKNKNYKKIILKTIPFLLITLILFTISPF